MRSSNVRILKLDYGVHTYTYGFGWGSLRFPNWASAGGWAGGVVGSVWGFWWQGRSGRAGRADSRIREDRGTLQTARVGLPRFCYQRYSFSFCPFLPRFGVSFPFRTADSRLWARGLKFSGSSGLIVGEATRTVMLVDFWPKGSFLIKPKSW